MNIVDFLPQLDSASRYHDCRLNEIYRIVLAAHEICLIAIIHRNRQTMNAQAKFSITNWIGFIRFSDYGIKWESKNQASRCYNVIGAYAGFESDAFPLGIITDDTGLASRFQAS